MTSGEAITKRLSRNPGTYPWGVCMSYSVDQFYSAREGTKSYLTEYAKFSIENAYIFRFLVRRFTQELPSGMWSEFILGVPGFLAVDLPEYDISAMALQKVPQASKVIVYAGGASWPVWEETVMTDNSSWMLDVVVRPTRNVSRVWTHPSAWESHIKAVLNAWKGVSPDVRAMGIVPVPTLFWSRSEMYEDQIPIYDAVGNFWMSRTPVLNVRACTEQELIEFNMGKGPKCPRVTRTDFGNSAWQKGWLGQDGLGLATGLSDVPSSLSPITILSSGTTPLPVPRPPGTEPPPAFPKLGSIDSTTAVVLIFAAVGFVTHQKLFGDR